VEEKKMNKKMRWPVVAAMLVALVPMVWHFTPLTSGQRSKDVNISNRRFRTPVKGLENYDIRNDGSKEANNLLAIIRAKSGKSKAVRESVRAEMRTAEADLRKRVPALRVEYNPDLDAPEVIGIDPLVRAFLAHPVGAGPGRKNPEFVRSFLSDNNGLFSLTPAQIAELTVRADYANPDGNLSYVILAQEINGIPVFRGEVEAMITRQGEIARMINNLAPGLDYQSLQVNGGHAEDAVVAAAGYINRQATAAELKIWSSKNNGKVIGFERVPFADPITAELMYFPTEPGVATLAWRVLLWEPVDAYYVIVDAATGKMLWRKNISNDQTQSATYNIYNDDSPSPLSPTNALPGSGIQGAVFYSHSFLAQGVANPLIQTTALQTLEGTLEIVWGDPRPGSGSGGDIRYALRLADGSVVPLQLTGQEGAAVYYFRKQVIVTGRTAKSQAAAGNVQAAAPLVVDSIAPSQALKTYSSATVIGTKKVIYLLAKFSDDAAVPHPPVFYTDLNNPDTPPAGEVFPTTINAFFKKISGNQFSWVGDVGGVGGVGASGGWLTLPHPKSFYAPCNFSTDCAGPNLGTLADDATALGRAQGIDFKAYDNINIVVSNDLDCCAWGGGYFSSVDNKSYGATWEPPWGQNTATYGHEMSHSLGLPHSGWVYYAYDSPWDTLSAILTLNNVVCGSYNSRNNGNALTNLNCAEPGDGFIMEHRDYLGWIPAANQVVTNTSPGTTVALEASALPFSSAIKEIKICLPSIPCTGSTAHYFTVEARVKGLGATSQFDNAIPGEGVIIHDVLRNRSPISGTCFFNNQSGWAVPIDATPGDYNSATCTSSGALFNAQWTPGQTYTNATYGLTIAVLSRTGSTFMVAIGGGSGSVIQPDGPAAITAESLSPPNGAPDPTEQVTATFPLKNVGTVSTTNLVATLQTSGGVTAIPAGENQNYGVVVAGGATVSRPFTFRADGTCGATITATFQLQDGATNLGNITYNFQLGTNSTTTPLTQNFDGVAAPALPAGWTTSASGTSATLWVTSTTTPVSAPNDVFAPDLTNVADDQLISPTIAIQAGGGQVTFKNLYNMENLFDGMVLEISINGGAFNDIITAGGSFVTGGYTATLASGSPIGGRQAWTGLSGGTTAAPTYITTTVNLPSASNGLPIVLKWRAASDSSVAAAGAAGVLVDNITVTTFTSVCTAATTLRIDSITPPAGRTSGGQQIVLTGAFPGLSTVTMGGVGASFFYTNGGGDTSKITVTTPVHAVGAVQIDLTPASGPIYSKPNAFVYLPTVFTDDMLVVGSTTAKAQHIIELRQAVDAMRAVAGLGGAPWTDPTLSPASIFIRAVHIQELRTYLNDAATRLGYSTSPYTEPSLTGGFIIKRVHIDELRQRIRNIAG
jgi:hypothetical protein